MKIYVTTDTYFGHNALAEKLKVRPRHFDERIIRNWQNTVAADDLITHLGDVVVGKSHHWDSIIPKLPGRKILVLGNHDKKSASWYMKNGFEFCCSQFTWEVHGLNIILSHKPVMDGVFDLNIHGHLHGRRHRECNVDQRHYLLALEETHYQPRLLSSIVKQWEKSNKRKARDNK